MPRMVPYQIMSVIGNSIGKAPLHRLIFSLLCNPPINFNHSPFVPALLALSI